MPFVDLVPGDILEGGYDLTVFPCSAKGTVRAATKTKIDFLQIPEPSKMGLGDISEIHKVADPNAGTKYIVYGASVLNDYSSEETIKKIARKLGQITCDYHDITNVDTPLLGTGAGRLPEEISAKALKEGFIETARKDARLTIHLFRDIQVEKIRAYLENPLFMKDHLISVPPGLKDSLATYNSVINDHKSAFLIMSFENSSAHKNIAKVIKETCQKHGIIVLRSDDRQFTDDLLDNVLTYIYGCDFGIAVFERIRREIYNPNVSYEAGYLMGLGKPLLFLKDETLLSLPTDLIGNLYKPFDILNPYNTLPKQIEDWLKDKGFI